MIPIFWLQRVKRRHEANQNREVRYDVEGCVGEPQSFLIQAARWTCIEFVPEIVYRVTGENRSKDGREAVGADEGQECPTCCPHTFCDKNAEALGDDGIFDKGETDVVDYDGSP